MLSSLNGPLTSVSINRTKIASIKITVLKTLA